MKTRLTLAAVAVLAWASAAQAANYPTDHRPIVEAGPGGQAVAVAGFATVGSAFAAAGGAFGTLTGRAPSVPDAVALDATGTTTALDTRGAQVQASVAPPGAPFGPPQSLGQSTGTRPLLAVNPGGAAAAAWSERGRLRVAVRLPGASFAQAMDAGPAINVGGVTITADGTVRALISRRRGPAPPTRGRTDAVLVTIRIGAAGPDAVLLDGEVGLGLGQSDDGQLLAAMQGSGPSDGRLVTQLVDANGQPGPAAILVGKSAPEGGLTLVHGDVMVLGAVLETDGRAVVALTILDRDVPSGVVVAEGTAVGGLAALRRLDRDGELSGARLAANARGDAVLVWSASGYRPRAALRPAGGRFGTPLIVSALAGDPPTAGVLPDGQALVGWTERDVLTSRQVVARVTGAGAGSPQVLAERSVRLRPAARARCRAARRTVLARDRFAVYRRVGRGSRRELCSLITGVAEPLNDGAFGDFLDSVRLAGPLAARATLTGEDAGPDPYAAATVVVSDTRTGRPLGPLTVGLAKDDAIGDLALTPDGAYAVTVCTTGVDLYGVSSPTDLARRHCARPSRRVRVVVVDGLGPGGARVVSRGRTVDPRSLRIRGRRVTWRAGRRTRSATLRRIHLPG